MRWDLAEFDAEPAEFDGVSAETDAETAEIDAETAETIGEGGGRRRVLLLPAIPRRRSLLHTCPWRQRHSARFAGSGQVMGPSGRVDWVAGMVRLVSKMGKARRDGRLFLFLLYKFRIAELEG